MKTLFLTILSLLSLTACDLSISSNFPLAYKQHSIISEPPRLFVMSSNGLIPVATSSADCSATHWSLSYPEFKIESFSFYSELEVEIFHHLSGGEYLQLKYTTIEEGMELWMPNNPDEIIFLDGVLGQETLFRPFLSVRKKHGEEWPHEFISFDLVFQSNPEASISDGGLYGFQAELGDTIVLQQAAIQYHLQ